MVSEWMTYSGNEFNVYENENNFDLTEDKVNFISITGDIELEFTGPLNSNAILSFVSNT